MSLRKFHKVTSLPTTKDADAFYAVINGDNVDFYLTDQSGVEKSICTDVRINDLITAAISGQSAIEIVNDMTERNALTLSANALVLVLDASDDSTVDAGAATYAYRHSNTSWNKIAEHESQDVSIAWGNISGRPASSTADIDDAVNKKHSHTNLSSLEKIGENASNEMTFNGQVVNSWDTNNW